MSMMKDVSTPEVHAEHEAKKILGKSTIDEWSVLEKVRSFLLTVVSVSEHG